MKYWKEIYGTRSNEFIEGVIEGVRAYAVWKDGKEHVGVQQQPLKDVIKEIRVQLEWREE